MAITNFGKTPASDVLPSVRLIPDNVGYWKGEPFKGELIPPTDPNAELRKTCDNAALGYEMRGTPFEPWGWLQFPNAEKPFIIGVDGIGDPKAFRERGARASDNTSAFLALVCTVYGTEYDKSVHETGLVYALTLAGNKGIDIDKLPVVAPDLQSQRFVVSPGFAR
jgi:hypothetical protein